MHDVHDEQETPLFREALAGGLFIIALVFGPWLVIAGCIGFVRWLDHMLASAAPGTPLLLAGVVIAAAVSGAAMRAIFGRR